MIPHKTARGTAAMERLKVFEGVPPPYDKKEASCCSTGPARSQTQAWSQILHCWEAQPRIWMEIPGRCFKTGGEEESQERRIL